MKSDQDATLDWVFDISQGDNLAEEPKIESTSVPAPSEEEMSSFYAELNNCKFKPVALSLVPSFAESFVLKSAKFRLFRIYQILSIKILNIPNSCRFVWKKK